MRYPCIVRWPGNIPAGSVCRELTTAMDVHPTLAQAAGTELPADRVIDGRSLLSLLQDPENSKSPHEAFFYYRQDKLEAVRSGPWKLHTSKADRPLRLLYNLESDPGELDDLCGKYPEVVSRLEGLASKCRHTLGDGLQGITGTEVRPVGEVENPVTQTLYDPNHPYIEALYDLKERG